jgi:hypothetical protein
VPGERRTYRFLVGPKPTLPDEIVAFACLDFVGRQSGMRTATLTRLTVDPGSPGRIFRLDEGAIYEALLRLQERGFPLSVAAVGGINQFGWSGAPDELAWYVLTAYFHTVSGSQREVAVPVVSTSSARQRGASLSVEDLDAKIASAT